MQVLSIIHYPVYGGPHNRNSNVAKILRASDIRTIVLLPAEEGNAATRLRKEGIEVIQIPLQRLRSTKNIIQHYTYITKFIRDIREIRTIIREYNIDLVQINGLANPQGAIAARLERVPVLWQLLDTVTPTLIRWILIPLVKRLSTVIMSTGKKVAYEHLGVSPYRGELVTFYPPVDLNRFKMDKGKREKARQELGVREDEIIIGNVSNINPKKGHMWFIRAAALLMKKCPRARFIILGTTYETHADYAKELWKTANELGLTLGDKLVVMQPAERIPDLESAFDIFWMTSEPKSEGISTAVEEAMALGIPVVCTDVGSMSEIIIDGKTGYIVNPRDPEAIVDATEKLLADVENMKNMGKNAHKMALELFSSENCATAHMRAYKKAISEAK